MVGSLYLYLIVTVQHQYCCYLQFFLYYLQWSNHGKDFSFYRWSFVIKIAYLIFNMSSNMWLETMWSTKRFSTTILFTVIRLFSGMYTTVSFQVMWCNKLLITSSFKTPKIKLFNNAIKKKMIKNITCKAVLVYEFWYASWGHLTL